MIDQLLRAAAVGARAYMAGRQPPAGADDVRARASAHFHAVLNDLCRRAGVSPVKTGPATFHFDVYRGGVRYRVLYGAGETFSAIANTVIPEDRMPPAMGEALVRLNRRQAPNWYEIVPPIDGLFAFMYHAPCPAAELTPEMLDRALRVCAENVESFDAAMRKLGF